MAFSRTFVTLNQKGKMKCFRCRKEYAVKDGGWHDAQSNQVFLCRFCSAAPSLAELNVNPLLQVEV